MELFASVGDKVPIDECEQIYMHNNQSFQY